MKKLNKRFADLLVYGLGTIANSALGFVLLPIYMKRFTPSEYGVINVFLLIVTFSSMFVSAGMMSSLQRLFFITEAGERKKLLGSTIIWYLGAIALLACVVVPLRSDLCLLFFKTASYAREFILVLIIVALTLVLDVPLNVLRLERRAVPYVSFSIFRLLSELGLKILFIVVLKQGIYGYFISSIISLLMVSLAVFVYSSKDYSLAFSWKQLQRMLKLGFPFIFTGFSIWSLNAMARLQLNFLSGTAATGIYSAGLRFAQVFNILFYKPISMFLPPIMLSDPNENESAWQRFPRLLNVLTLFGGLAAALIALFSVEGVRLITKYLGTHLEYLEAIQTIPSLTFSFLLYALTIPVGYMALRIEKTMILAYTGAIAALANILLNFLLIRLSGVSGAAWATFLAYLIYVVSSYAWIQAKKKVSYTFLKNILQFMVAFLLTQFLSIIQFGPLLIALAVKVVVTVLLIGLFGWKLTRLLDAAMTGSIKHFFARTAK